jgi:hypothetical protein
MKIFISYPYESKSTMIRLRDYLTGRGFSSIFRDDRRISPGEVISNQLRDAFVDSDCCIFLLTKYSQQSAWCMQEIGAFWGAGKPIIVYRTDRSLKVPPLFSSDRLANTQEEVYHGLSKLEKIIRDGVAPVDNVVQNVFPHAESGDFREFVKKLIPCTKRIRLIGAALDIFADPDFKQKVMERAASGHCELEIYLADPRSPAVETRLIEEELGDPKPGVGRTGIINRVQDLVRMWEARRSPPNINIRLFANYPTFALLIFGDDYFIYPYGCNRLGNFSPVFQFSAKVDRARPVIEFLEGQYSRVKESSVAATALASRSKGDRALDQSLYSFALYFVPPQDSELYRFGSKVLGYDVRQKQPLDSDWQQYVGSAQAFGFHLTVCDALYFLTEGELKSVINEVEFVAKQFQPFDLSRLVLTAGCPDESSISLVSTDPSGTLEALHHEFVHRVYRRAVASNYTLGSARLTRHTDPNRARLMMERYRAPYIFNSFVPHFTLLTGLTEATKGKRAEIYAQLSKRFTREVSSSSVRVDRLAVMSQAAAGSPWMIRKENIVLG